MQQLYLFKNDYGKKKPLNFKWFVY